MKNKILKPLLFSFVIILMGIVFVSVPTEARKLTKKQNKKVCKNIKLAYDTDKNQIYVKKFKKMSYFKYKKGKKIKVADKKTFNKYLEIDDFNPILVDNKKISHPSNCNYYYGYNYDFNKNQADQYFNHKLTELVVKKLTPGWHTIKFNIIYSPNDNSKKDNSRQFTYTIKTYVTESIKFSSEFTDQRNNIYACRDVTKKNVIYKYIGFKFEPNFMGKLDTKATFKVDKNHFINGAGKRNGFSSDEECLKFLQNSIKDDVVISKTFDLKPFDRTIHTLKVNDFDIYKNIKEKTDYEYINKPVYNNGVCITTINYRVKKYTDLFWKCIRPEISVKITSSKTNKVFLNKTYTKVNEDTRSKVQAIPDEFCQFDIQSNS